MGTFPFQGELQWELGKVVGVLKTVFFGVPIFPEVGEYKTCNTKLVEKYAELPTKHEPKLKH